MYAYGLLWTIVDKMYFAIDGYLPMYLVTSCTKIKEMSVFRLDGLISSLLTGCTCSWPSNRQNFGKIRTQNSDLHVVRLTLWVKLIQSSWRSVISSTFAHKVDFPFRCLHAIKNHPGFPPQTVIHNFPITSRSKINLKEVNICAFDHVVVACTRFGCWWVSLSVTMTTSDDQLQNFDILGQEN